MKKKILKNSFCFNVIALILFGGICYYDYNNSQKLQETINEYNQTVFEEIDGSIEEYLGLNSSSLSDFSLNLKSAYKDEQATHPKILRFNNYWNGYKYWLAFTPYPFGDQAKENPHIMVSNDMIYWKTVRGFKNPLDEPIEKKPKQIYNSDTHLVYNSDTEELECYWRYVNDINGKVIIYKSTTKNGYEWSEKEIFKENIRRKVDYLSPTIIYENKIYKMWYVDRNLKIMYIEYDSEYDSWSEAKEIKINYPDKNLKSWHLDVIKTDKGYEAIIVAFTDFKDRSKMNLYYSYSIDNNLWSDAKTILKYKNGGIYRSSLLYINDTYYVFYSFISPNYRRGVSISYGKDITKLNGLKRTDKNKFAEYIRRNG